MDTRIGQFTPLLFKKNNEIELELMNSFHYKTRNSIRKAIKCGVEITEDNNAMQFIQKTHQENMLTIGGKSKTNFFFSKVPEIFVSGKDYKIYIAKFKGEMIAGLFLFYFNQIVEYFTPVIKSNFRSMQPLSLLIYKAMLDANANGYTQWNWGGTWQSQEGVYRFQE